MHLNAVLAHLDEWLPIVRQMRPGQPWEVGIEEGGC